MKSNIGNQISGQPIYFWVTLLLGILTLGFYGFAGIIIYKHGTRSINFGWTHSAKNQQNFIYDVTPNGPAAGKLMVGDKIIAINADTSVQNGDVVVSTISFKRREISHQDSYIITVERNGKNIDYRLSANEIEDHNKLAIALSLFVGSLAFFISGLLIGIIKPDQPVARLMSLSMFFNSIFLLASALRPISMELEGYELVGYYLCWIISPMQLSLGYDIYHQFPPGIRVGRFWSILKYILYIWGGVLLVAWRWRDTLYVIGNISQRFPFNSHLIRQFFYWADNAFFVCTLAALLAVITRNFFAVKEPDQRRRIKWVVYCSVIGLMPVFIINLCFFIIPALGYGEFILSTTFFAMQRIGELMISILPIAFGYVIIKHRIFDIDVIVRRGLQYLLAKNVLKVVLIGEVLFAVGTIILKPKLTIGEIFSPRSIYFYLFMTTILSFVFRDKLSHWIDRRFFRGAYDREGILTDLINEIKKQDSITEISKLVSSQLDSTLHPKCIFFYYRDEEMRDLTLDHSTDQSRGERIPQNWQLLRIMASEERAREFDFSQQLPLEESRWLERLSINMIVPMSGTDHHLVGLLLLGEKRSEEPYSRKDREMLEAIAGQMAVVYENSLLKEKVGKEQRIKREVLARLENQQINLVKECPACGRCFDSIQQFCDKDNRELTLTLPVERIINNKYRLDRLIGRGGMGAVYKARDLHLERDIAIKILLGSMFGDQESLRRFEREARTSAKLAHPNIVSVYDYGRLDTEGAYLVMEFIQGCTLRAKLNEEHALPAQVVADWFEQILDGVKAAHQSGIIHRDLKPDNVLISTGEQGREVVKILDFGIAKIKKLETNDQKSLTVPGAIIGTFGYMPPEQFSGGEIDERSDIFSLGVMIVEALTGQRPFNGRTIADLLNALNQDSFHLPGDTKEILRLDALLQRCLTIDRKKRFASIEEMEKELIPAIRNCPSLVVSEFPASISAAATVKRVMETNDADTRRFTADTANEEVTKMIVPGESQKKK